MFKGPDIQKGDGSLGAKSANELNIHGICFGGVLPDDGDYDTLGEVVRLLDAKDADALGLTIANDIAKKVLIRYHINEYFRLNPNGQLWIMIVAQDTTQTDMVNPANDYVKKLINDSGKKIKSFGTVLNPSAAYVEALSGGVATDVLTAIPMAQTLVDEFAGQNIYIDMALIEGRHMNGTFAQTNFRTLASANARCVVGQDKDVADLDALFEFHAGVGTYLGSHGVRRPEEDEGSITSENNPRPGQSTMPISDTATGAWVNPALSSGTLVKDLTPNQVALLKTNAYLFADVYPEFPGVYWSGSHACTLLSSDFAFGVNTRVWNYAARIVTQKLTPKFNSKVATDDAGNIATTTASGWQEDINEGPNGLKSMVTDEIVTKAETFINPAQNIYEEGEFEVEMTIKPYGYARSIKGKLSFTNK